MLALGVFGRVMAFSFGGLILSAPGAYYAGRFLGGGAVVGKQQAGLWGATDLRQLAKGDAMRTVLEEIADKSPALTSIINNNRLDTEQADYLRVVMSDATEGSRNEGDVKLSKFADTYEPALVCGSAGSAASDGPAVCETECSRKSRPLEFHKPHPGACRVLCAVAAELCQESKKTWTIIVLRFAWDTWDTLQIAGFDIRSILLTILSTVLISRATVHREDPTDKRRRPGAENDAAWMGVEGIFEGGEPAVREAMEYIGRNEAAKYVVEEMVHAMLAAREQMQHEMHHFYDMHARHGREQ